MQNNEMLALEDQTCPAVGYQSASICVPVTVNPFAKNRGNFYEMLWCACGDPRKSYLRRRKKWLLRFYNFPGYLCSCSG